MNFTFTEWAAIIHDMEVAAAEYERTANECKPSDDEMSLYQIFKRQAAETRARIERAKNQVL